MPVPFADERKAVNDARVRQRAEGIDYCCAASRSCAWSARSGLDLVTDPSETLSQQCSHVVEMLRTNYEGSDVFCKHGEGAPGK